MHLNNVLSLFDGMGGGVESLKRTTHTWDEYLASEIDANAIQICKKNHPDVLHVGDVTRLCADELPDNIDLLIGGSPCQGFSFAGHQLNFDDPRSRLFFEFVRLKNEIKPKWWLLENVPMKKEYQDIISSYLGTEPIMINSALVSAQNRKRLYWTNIPVEQPEDRNILLEDIVESDALVDRDKAHSLIATLGKKTQSDYFLRNKCQFVYSAIQLSNIYGGFKEQKPRVHLGKSVTIRTAGGGGHIPSLIINGVSKDFTIEELRKFTRKVTPLECERLQTFPDGYTEGVSNTQRYTMLGNGWTVDVIAHILRGIA